MMKNKVILNTLVLLSVITAYFSENDSAVAQNPLAKDGYHAAIEECGVNITLDGDFSDDGSTVSADNFVKKTTHAFMEVPAEERGPIIDFYIRCLKITLAADKHSKVIDTYNSFANKIENSAEGYDEPLDQETADHFSSLVLSGISSAYYPFIERVRVSLSGGYREVNLSSTLDMQRCNGHFSGKIAQAEVDINVRIEIVDGNPINVVTRAIQLECGSVNGSQLTKNLADLATENSGCLAEMRLKGVYPPREAGSINIPAKGPIGNPKRDMKQFMSACN